MKMPTLAETEAIRDWMLVTFDEMVAAGSVVPPWSPPGPMYDLLVSYYRMALTPQEAAEAAFAVYH